MKSRYRYQDTPSIISNEIADVGTGRKLSYSDLTARQKRDYLFDEGIRKTEYSREERPNVTFGATRFLMSAARSYFSKLLSKTALTVSEELEVPKRKLFHTYGATAKIVFTPEPDTPYTGIFSDTAPGLVRFSYAGPVIGVGRVPGLGLKFPVDGNNPSENLVAMRTLDRQKTTSVFENLFTNILPLPHVLNVIMRIVNRRFETVNIKGKGLHQAADNLAGIHSNGLAVAKEKVNAPFRLIFRPTAQVKSRSDRSIDFRDDLAANVKAGTPIYEVLALSESQEAELNKQGRVKLEDLVDAAKRIGMIATESEFIASAYGDHRLFFKHSERFIQEKYKPASKSSG